MVQKDTCTPTLIAALFLKKEKSMLLLKPRVLGNKLTQKDNADSGVQFITLAGPRQSLLLAKDPDQVL